MTSPNDQFPDDALQQCVETLKQLAKSPQACLARDGAKEKEVADAAALLLRRVKAERKREGKLRDQEVVSQANIRSKRTKKEYGRYLTLEPAAMSGAKADRADVSLAPRLNRPQACYICKRRYDRLHHFYDAICDKCGETNYEKRHQSADLSERTFVVTGGRIKIGFQTALKLLRAGASVVITTRFPHDAAFRFASEADQDGWIDRVRIHAADFRSIGSVDQMCAQIQHENPYIDGLINNAAQTVRRPAQYYRHLLLREADIRASLSADVARVIAPLEEINERIGIADRSLKDSAAVAPSALMSQAPLLAEDWELDPSAFPLGQFDADGQQIDERESNSWTMPLAAVSVGELLEVHAINSLVPFLLIQRLESMLIACPRPDRYIVNVSAMEGQLNTHTKAPRHPHTNMAKAGMNMVTRTCASEFASRGIFMNSVDTGWITNEFPLPRTQEMRNDGFEPPLDEIDGAARVLDPVFLGVGRGIRTFGKFLKDYRAVAW